MIGYTDSGSLQVTVINTTAAGNSAIVTINADSQNRWCLDAVTCSYASAVTNGSLLIQDNTNNTVLFNSYITATGPSQFSWGEKGFQCPLNAQIVITLADGNSSKHLSVVYR